MERYTEKSEWHGEKYVRLRDSRNWIKNQEYDGNVMYENATVRLAKYEDTGLTPDEITEMVKRYPYIKSLKKENSDWIALSQDAKNVIEWVENPFTHERQTLCIKVGSNFHMDGHGTGDVDIKITKPLFAEIYNFVCITEELDCIMGIDGDLLFSLKPGYTI